MWPTFRAFPREHTVMYIEGHEETARETAGVNLRSVLDDDECRVRYREKHSVLFETTASPTCETRSTARVWTCESVDGQRTDGGALVWRFKRRAIPLKPEKPARRTDGRLAWYYYFTASIFGGRARRCRAMSDGNRAWSEPRWSYFFSRSLTHSRIVSPRVPTVTALPIGSTTPPTLLFSTVRNSKLYPSLVRLFRRFYSPPRSC